MTFYYHRTLCRSSGITHSVVGNFLGEEKEDIIASTGRILKLLRFKPDNKDIETLITEDTYDTICSLSKFRRKDKTKDWFVFTTDSGNATVLAVDEVKMSFELVLQEDFKAKIPRTLPVQHLSADSHGRAVSMDPNPPDVFNVKISRKVPGQHLAVDSQGCAFFIAAVESLKQLWFFTDPGNDNLLEILDASEENVLIYDIAFVDIKSENLVIAYLTTAYKELHAGVRYELRERQKPSLVFCEGNLDKLTEIKRIKCLDYANSLISVPGEKGVLVCAEDFIAFYSVDSSDIIRCSIPKRIRDPKKGVIFVCSTKYNEKNSIYYLAQTEQGDIFKIQLVISDSGVNEIILKYFITLPVASALCALESGFLFVASEFGDHHFYEIADIENRARCQPSFSSARQKLKHYFFLHRIVDIAPVAEIKSLSPIMQMELATLSSNRQQMCLATGRASSSALKISTLQQDVSYLFRVKIDKETDEIPVRMWAIESTKTTSTKPETLIVVSFEYSTAVYSLEKTVEYEIKKTEGRPFAINTNTLGCAKTGEDAIVQICPEGICVITEGENNLLIKPEKEDAIENCAINKKCVVVVFKNKLMTHQEIDKNGVLMRPKIRRLLNEPVTCMLLSDSSESDQLLAVGISIPASSGVKVIASVKRVHLFIVSESKMKLLAELPIDDSPYSFLFLKNESKQDLLLIGCEDGIVLTFLIEKIGEKTAKKTVDSTDFEYTEINREKVDSKAVQLLLLSLQTKERNQCILAISDHSWVKESVQGDFIQLKSYLSPCICTLPERVGLAIGIGTILEYSFRIFVLDDLQSKPAVTIPLEYTPKKLSVDSCTKKVFILAADDKSYTAKTIEKKENEFQQHLAAREDSNLPPVENIPKSWASIFQVIDLSEEIAIEVCKLAWDQNVAALSFCHFKEDDGYFLLIGAAKDFDLSTACCTEALVYIYKMETGEPIFLHKITISSAPLAMCYHEGIILIGSGRKLLLCILEPGTFMLHLLCEKKDCVANSITAIYPAEDRILVSDSEFGVSCLVYIPDLDSLHLLKKDIAPTELTAACFLNDYQMVRATKSRDIFIVELGALETRQVPIVYNEAEPLCTLSKEKLIACFHIGEVVTSLKTLNIFPNEPDAVVYTTLAGSVGVLFPLVWEKDARYLDSLNTAMQKTLKEIDKKRFRLKLSQHFQFRSHHFKCENVVDGDFLDQFLKLEVEHQITIAREMDEEEDIPENIIAEDSPDASPNLEEEHQATTGMEVEDVAQNVTDGDLPGQSPNLQVETQATISSEEKERIAEIYAVLENIRKETKLDFQF